ncbi:MAG: cupin domain-containing protein [Nitratiruptor sp.]|nr:cupin domain-containing protein [Nitratiruptor sp.]NPA83359.1 cupin domain-containing protein [Campylobacterota bacterium]
MVKVVHTGISDPNQIRQILHREGFGNIFLWSDRGGTSYPPHRHPHHEVRWIVEGELIIEQDGRRYHLRPGDRLESSPNLLHSAYAPCDVTYICGSK